jgi:hypothetical protein
MRINALPKTNLENAFLKLGWIKKEARDERYDIFISKENENVWTLIPKNEATDEYLYYQDKNLRILTSLLDLEETEFNVKDVYSQIQGYNYKIINKLETTEGGESIPLDFFQNVPLKTIESFRYFYSSKTKGKKHLSIDDFNLHHTIKGSFIIPISVSAKDDDSGQQSLISITPTMNIYLHDYLNTVEDVANISTSDREEFSSTAFEKGIDSKLIKDFLSINDSVAKYREKYADKIKSYSLSSSSSPFLDHNLPEKDRLFPTVNLSKIATVPDEYIFRLEELEVSTDESNIKEHDVEIGVMVDAVAFDNDENNTAKFSVLSVGKTPLDKHFKAVSVELTRHRFEICTDMLKSREVLTIKGDISKRKGKIGKIIPEDFILDRGSEKLF